MKQWHRFWRNVNRLRRIVRCHHCGARCRIPFKLGATLRVTCPTCGRPFQVACYHQIIPTIMGRLKGSTRSRRDRWGMIVIVIIIIWAIVVIAGGFDSKKPSDTQLKSHWNTDVI